MPNQILVPSLGESVTEATVSRWCKQVGDTVDSDEPLVELETDKVNIEVPSPSSGTLTSIKVEEGSIVEVGALLGTIKEGKSSSVETIVQEENGQQQAYAPSRTVKKKRTIDKKSKKTDLKNQELLNLVDAVEEEHKKEKPLILNTLSDTEINNSNASLKNEQEQKHIPPRTKQNLSPSVRKIVEENKIDLSNIEGSGKDGRISKGDLLNLMNSVPQPSIRKATHGPEERVKMTKLRVTIAKRLKEAQDNAAMLTTFNEVDMSAIIEIRKNNQEDFHNRFGIKLGFMSFFVKASILALKLYPEINAEIEDQDIIYKNYYNISFAVGTEKGLVVPVIKNADELSFAEIEKNIKLISEKARGGKITIDDLQGGTFTISNGGVYGSMLSTPILNPPQSGVLGMHNIIERPIVVNGEIKIRPVMYLALSYDHRIIDGKDSVSFLKTIKENLENPGRLFLNI